MSARQQNDQSAQLLTFRAPVPFVETVHHDPDHDSISSDAGQPTPPDSDSETPDERNYAPNGSVASLETASNLSISEPLGALTLSSGQSMSINADLFDVTSGHPDTPGRHTFVRNLLPSHNQPDPDEGQGDQTNTDSEDEDDSDISSLDDMPRELLPSAPMFDSDLQGVLRDVKEHFSSIISDMEQCPLIADQESDFSRQHDQVRMASQLDCPETRTVGFIGDSGVGKSRLINSLLNLDGLARSSAEGSACTSVVTEFRDIDPHHPSWTIEVLYMNSGEVRELLEELLESFRMYYTDIFREVINTQEQERIREQSTRAWATFQSMFRNQPDLTHEFLADQTEAAHPRILERLHEWTQPSFRQRPGGPALQHKVILGSFNRCQSYLDRLTIDPQDERETAIWPFIKLIRVYLRSPILHTGLVLTDLPGFRDLNFARIRATDRYLKHSCNEVFVVTTISRCITDQSIDEIKSQCNNGQPIRIVCTRSEDVIADEMARQHSDLAPEINRLERCARQTQSRLDEAVRAVNVGNLHELITNKDRAQFERDQFLIRNRNQRVETCLRKKHGEEIRIFCISNKLHSRQRAGNSTHNDDYLELSGIRELRHYCQLVPAEAQFRFVAVFLEHRAPAVLRSVKQWTLTGCDNVTAERAKILRRVLLDIKTAFREALIPQNAGFRAFSGRLKERFNDEILEVAYEQASEWKESALRTSGVWQNWYHPTYGAFCRKYGTHSTGNVGFHCWNTELLGGTQADLEESWSSLENWILIQKRLLNDAVRAAFQRNLECLEDNIQLAPVALKNLIDNMDDREACITNSVEQLLNNLMKALSLIKGDALYGHASSYMAGLMRPVYNKCNGDSGQGVDARRKCYMRDHLTNTTIFLHLIEAFNNDCRSLFEETFSKLKQVTHQEMENLYSDIHNVTAEEGEVTEATRFPSVASSLRDKVGVAESTLEQACEIVGRLRSTSSLSRTYHRD